jgi:branched-chain amino acid transport system ATP-binding protein
MPISPADGGLAGGRAPASGRPEPFLAADDIVAGYGATIVVHGASIAVGRGEVACVLGPNGSGKSTLMKAITGDLAVRGGSVRLAADDVTGMRRDQLVRRGLRLVPQENIVFNALTVRENLAMGGYVLKRREVAGALDRVYATFPALKAMDRSVAGRLSGGERKLVAIGRALMTEPSVVVLDEPSASLSPQVSSQLLAERIPALAEAGVAVVLIEQRALQALGVADWAYILVAGGVELSAPAAEVVARGDIGELFLGRRPAASSSS